MKTLNLGDICTSKLWISFKIKPPAWWRWGFDTRPTYTGTTAGIYIATPLFVILGHKRP